VTESSASGTETATQEFCFDSDTGFLEQTRMWEGTARGAHDVVVTYRDGTSQGTRTDGFVRHERYYGGDGATLGTGGLCNLSLSSPAYGQEHTYTCGVLATSEWTGTNFSTTDRTINCATGLVATSRDTSGLTTSYTYDALGRLTRVTPPTGLAQTNYLYSRYMPPGSENPGPAKVAIRRKNGNEVLAGEQYIFDGLGRVVNEQRDLPQGTVERDTTWTDRGEMDSRETWHPKGAGAQGTTLYSGYDPFGRPGQITLPDGYQVTLGYIGERSRTTTVSIGETLGASHAVSTTDESTEEIYDRFGRLREVREPDDGSGTPKTRYAYDVLGNLTKVSQNVGSAVTTQTRQFLYDGRGFLTSESHPELGTTVRYSSFDPLGNPGRIERGGWDLRYTYDAAGRLLRIEQSEGACATSKQDGCWKEWTYATDNSTYGAYGKGKLGKMKRHNHVLTPADNPANRGAFDAWVEERYTYNGLGGALSDLQTVIGTGSPAGSGGADDNTRPVFDESVTYSALGDVASRSYPNCSHRYCVTKTRARTVTQSFTEGLLTAIPGFASSITYHPSGMVATVEHGNGVTWSQAADPTGMARPAQIRTTGASADLNTGLYIYDGAGNVVRTGADRYLYDQVSRVVKADLGKYPESCSGSQTVTGTEAGQETYESCGSIDVGPYTIESSGDVTLRAEGLITFHDGFSVASGGSLAVEGGAAVNLSPPSAVQRTQSYTYDRFGNLTFVTTDGIGQSLQTDPATNRMSAQDIQYDTSGNVTAQPIGMGSQWEYTYDPFNMAWDVTRPDGLGWINVYGPGDERIWVIDWTDGASHSNWKETFTLRDFDGSPLRQYELDGGNGTADHWELTRDYVWRGNTLLAVVRNPGDFETVVHLHPDHLGTPRTLTDPYGATLETHVYFPFGQEATTPTNSEVLQFTGHERDDYDAGSATTVDLDYMHARYYSPHLGRFMSVDPSAQSSDPKLPQSWNRYAYVRGNPVKYIDSDGEFPILILAAAGVVGGLLLGAEAANAPSSADTPMIEDTGGMKAVAASSTVITGLRALMEAFGFGSEQPQGTDAGKPEPKSGSEGGPGAGKRFSQATKDAERERSGDQCVLCGKSTTSEPGPDRSEIDHAIPASRGGNNSPDNAQNTCRTCNRQKGTQTTEEFLRKKEQKPPKT